MTTATREATRTVAARELWRGTGSCAVLGLILRTLWLPCALAAGSGLVARGRGGDSCRWRIPHPSHTMPGPSPPDWTADPWAVSADAGVRRGRDRFGAALLLQRGAVPLGRRRSAAGIPGAGHVDRLALGANPPSAHLVSASGSRSVDRRPGLRPRSSRGTDAQSDRRRLGSGCGCMPERVLPPQRGQRERRTDPPAAADDSRHRNRSGRSAGCRGSRHPAARCVYRDHDLGRISPSAGGFRS